MEVTSIFLSVNGECCHAGQGSWTVFVRFFGCSAKCSYCDTKYSHEKGTECQKLSPREIVAEILKLDPGCNRVTLTGGEPLEQDMNELKELIILLSKLKYEISIETNGMQMPQVKKLRQELEGFRRAGALKLSFVADFKLPSSGKPWDEIVYGGAPRGLVSEDLIARNLLVQCKQFKILYGGKFSNAHDMVKFVISTKEDFDYAIKLVSYLRKEVSQYLTCYFSPCGIKAPAQLFEWMKEAGCAQLDIGYSMQIHKVIFPGDWRDEEE